ncbi:MAG: hypothetical protein ABI862_21760 [Ilumatobacteraceae bacterium]
MLLPSRVVGQIGGALMLVALSTSCGEAQSNGTQAHTTDALAVHGLKSCREPPFAGLVGSMSDSTVSTTAALIAGTNPAVFAGVWWDGAATQYVFDTVDVVAATAILDVGLPPGTSYRVDAVPRSFTALRALRDRAMALDLPGRFMSAAPRSWDGSVDISIQALDDAVLSVIAEEFSDERDAICVSVVGEVS